MSKTDLKIKTGIFKDSCLSSGNVGKSFWLIWILILCLTFIIQLSTADVLPNFPKDEAQITDYGRLLFSPRSDWSIIWLLEEGKPILLWSYFGPLISELSFQIFGYSGIGTRVLALLGGIVAATMMVLYLLARGIPAFAAWWLGLVFLLDPLFALSQRLGRVDSWVIALCIASCWLLRNSVGHTYYFTKVRVMAAGSLTIFASFVWPSAFFLYPLIALELIHLFRSEFAGRGSWRNIVNLFIIFTAGGFISLILLLVPIWQQLDLIISNMQTMLIKNVETSQSFFERLFSLFQTQQWLKLAKALGKTLSFCLPIFALAGALIKRDKPLMFVSFVAVGLIFSTLIYELRVLYLLPYFLILSSGIFSGRKSILPVSGIGKFGVSSLVIMAGWAVLVSIIIRTTLGIQVKEALDREKIHQAAAKFIGRGNLKVYLAETYEFYYAGRSLGWKQYTPYGNFDYDAQGNWIDRGYKPKGKFLKLFSNMDYAIFPKAFISKDLSELLKQSGLIYHQTIFSENEFKDFDDPPISRTRRMITWYLSGPTRYGPYLLYKRKRPYNPIVAN